MHIKLKELSCIDLGEDQLPHDPECCSIRMDAFIGPNDEPGADQFSFYVVTPNWLLEHPETRWGNGYLIVSTFTWQETRRMLERLISHISAATWDEAAKKLSNNLEWEFHNYQPHSPSQNR